MTTLYLTRHGETVWNTQKRMQGWNDSPLTELGVKQAKWLGERLEKEIIDVIYASPSGRAFKTAEIVRRNKNIEIIPRDNLREINMGNLEGKDQECLMREYENEIHNFWNAPSVYVPCNGETFTEVQDRAVEEIMNIAKENEGKNILVVTHTVVLKCFMAYVNNQPIDKIWDPPYTHQTSLTKVEIDGNDIKVIMHADTSHHKEVKDKNAGGF